PNLPAFPTRRSSDLQRRLQSFYGIVFGFAGSSLECPEDHRTIVVSNGMLKVFSLRFPPFQQSMFRTNIKADPIDDTTYRYQFAKDRKSTRLNSSHLG